MTDARTENKGQNESEAAAQGSSADAGKVFDPMLDMGQFMPEHDRIEEWKERVKSMPWCGGDDDCHALAFIPDALAAAKELDLSINTIVSRGKGGLLHLVQYIYRCAARCGHCTKDEIAEALSKAINATGVRTDGMAKLRADLPDLWYDRKQHCFWHQAADGNYQSIVKDVAANMLSESGLSNQKEKDGSPSEVDRHLLKVIRENGIDVPWPLAGYPTGLHSLKGKTLLVTHSYQRVEPKEPPSDDACDHILSLIGGMFGDETAYLITHLKQCYEALRDGRRTGGTAYIIVGPPDCGKTLLLEGVIRPLLGGRKANAYAFLSGKTDFNDELIGCEVHAIDDGNPFDTLEARKRFGNAIKESVAAGEMWCHPKGRAGFTAPTYRRLFILVNPEDMELMPELDESLVDKISILKAETFAMPPDCLPLPAWNEKGAREAFIAKLLEELPYFVHRLVHWEIPNDLKARRFGVIAYKNEDVLEQLRELSSLHEKSTVIQKGLFRVPEADLEGRSIEIEINALYERLLSSHVGDRAKALFRNVRALGSALGRISRDTEHKGYYKLRRSDGRSYWTVTCNARAGDRGTTEGEMEDALVEH